MLVVSLISRLLLNHLLFNCVEIEDSSMSSDEHDIAYPIRVPVKTDNSGVELRALLQSKSTFLLFFSFPVSSKKYVDN